MKQGVIFACLLVATTCRADILYNLDFEAPTYTDGQGIHEGLAPNMPPYSTDAPSVVAATGIPGFSSQVAHFHNGQMGFYGTTPVVTDGIHEMTFEMAVLNLSGAVDHPTFALAVTADTSATVGLAFYPSDIHVVVGGVLTTVPYTMGTPNDFRIMVDLDDNLASVWIDGTPAFEDEALASNAGFYRATFQANPANFPNDVWAVDNFQWNVIPEPTSACLFLAGVIVCTLGLKRRMFQPEHRSYVEQRGGFATLNEVVDHELHA